MSGQSKKEWYFFLFCFILVLTVMFFAEYRECKNSKLRQAEKLSSQVKVVQALIAHQFDAVDDTLNHITHNLSSWQWTRGRSNTADQQLLTLVDAIPSIRWLAVLDADGIVTSSSKADSIGRDFRSRAYFTAPKSNPDPKKLYISPPFKTVGGNWTINLSRVILDSDKKFVGVVTASLDAAELRIILSAVRYSSGMWVALAHEDGTLFMFEPDRPSLIGLYLGGKDTFFSKYPTVSNEISVNTDVFNPIGEHRMLATANIRSTVTATNAVLRVAVASDIDAVLNEIKKKALIRISIFTLLAAMCGCGLLVLQRRRNAVQMVIDQADDELRAARAQLEDFFTLIPDLLCITNLSGVFLKVNASWGNVLGYAAAKMEGTDILHFVHPDDQGSMRAMLSDLAKEKAVSHFVSRCRHQNGGYRFIEWHAVVQHELIYGTASDVTDRIENEQQMQFLAYHDQLTGLPNRSLFFDRFSQVISHATRHGEQFGLLFIDLDGFKLVNDRFGHDAGDTVLKVVAQRLRSGIRAEDTVARAGGDEFWVLLVNVAERSDCGSISEKIIDQISREISLDEQQKCYVGASIGISIFPEHGSDVESLLMAADTAMYSSKMNGKNRFTYFDEDLEGRKSSLSEMLIEDAPATGFDTIDRQHEHLVELVNLLAQKISHDIHGDELSRLFEEVIEFTAFHFQTENDLMERYAYPDRIAHEKDHCQLLINIRDLADELDEVDAASVVKNIKEWLVRHIEFRDIALGKFLDKTVGK